MIADGNSNHRRSFNEKAQKGYLMIAVTTRTSYVCIMKFILLAFHAL